MGKSAHIMKAMNRLINGPAVTETMYVDLSSNLVTAHSNPSRMLLRRSMAAEMQRAGIIGEMMDEALASAEPDGLEEEADEEVEKVRARGTRTASRVHLRVPGFGCRSRMISQLGSLARHPRPHGPDCQAAALQRELRRLLLLGG